MGSFIIEIIENLVVLIFQLIVDIFCIVLLLTGLLVGVWRLPWNLAIFIDMGFKGIHSEFRFACVFIFGSTLCDIFTFPLFLVTLFTWRMPHMLYGMSKETYHADCKDYMLAYRKHAAQHFFLFFLDIPFVIMSTLTSLMIWRGVKFWPRMAAHAAAQHGWLETNFREIIFIEFVWAIVDIPTYLMALPMAIVLGLTFYRVPIVRAEWAEIDCHKGDGELKKLLYKRAVFVVNFFLVLFDIPFVVMCVATVVLGWRARIVITKFMEKTDAKDRRLLITLHFFLTLVDYLVFFPMFFALACTMYRLVPLVIDLRNAIQPAASPEPILVLSAAVPRYLPLGFEVRCVRTKPPSFHFPANRPKAHIYVRNESVWTCVEKTLGRAAAFGGKALTPFGLFPKYINAATSLLPGRSDFDFTVSFDINISSETIRESIAELDRAGHPRLMLQVEHGAHAGTLFNMCFTFAELKNALETESTLPLVDTLPIPISAQQGEWLCEIFPQRVVPKFCLLMMDIYAFVCFIIIHFIPHRAYVMYTTAFTGTSQQQTRKVIRTLRQLKGALRRRPQLLRSVLEHVESDILSDVKGGRTRYVRPHVGFHTYLQEVQSCVKTLSENKHVALANSADSLLREDNALLHVHTSIIKSQLALCGDRGLDFSGLLGVIDDLQAKPIDDEQVAGCYHTLTEQLDASIMHGHVVAGETEDATKQCQELLLKHAGCDGNADGWAQVRRVVVQQTGEFVYDVLAFFCFLITFATVYRTYTVVSTVFSPDTLDKRKTCLWNVGQIFIDIMYLLKLLAVIACIRHAVSCLQDIVLFTSRNPSFKASRTVIDHYLKSSVSDIIMILTMVFAWRTIKYTVSAAVFGLFSPGILLDSTLSQQQNDSTNKGRTIFIVLFCCGWMYGFPFVMVYGMMPDNFTAAFAIFYTSMFFFFLVALIQGFRRDNSTQFTTVREIHMMYPNNRAAIIVFLVNSYSRT